MPFIKEVYETQRGQFSSMNVPFTNGSKVLQISVNIDKAYDSQAAEVIKQFERSISLAIIDQEWKEHLREMDDLRTNVQNASMEQKDPLLVYKKESYDVFLIMMEKINLEIVSFLMKAGILQDDPNAQKQRRVTPPQSPKVISSPKVMASRGNLDGTIAEQNNAPAKAQMVVGRNEACPCGSGKKFKQCCGKA